MNFLMNLYLNNDFIYFMSRFNFTHECLVQAFYTCKLFKLNNPLQQYLKQSLRQATNELMMNGIILMFYKQIFYCLDNNLNCLHVNIHNFHNISKFIRL